MLKVILALCLINSLVNGQVAWTTGTTSQAYTTNNVQSGSAADTGNGYTIGLNAPGWVHSNVLSLTAAATPVPLVIFTTLKTQTGGYVGVGIAQITGSGLQTTTCTALGTTAASTVSLSNRGGADATACPTDFITLYTANPASTTSTTGTSVITLAVNTPVLWTLTPPTSAGTAASACVLTTITPYSAITASGVPTAQTATIKNNQGGTPNTCDTTAPADAKRFTLTTQNAAGNAAVTAATFAFYVELGPSGTRGEVCFQTATQFALRPGTCSSSTIISGVLASIGLLVALLFN